MKQKQNQHLEYDKAIAEIAFNVLKGNSIPQTKKNFLGIAKILDMEVK